MQGKSGERAKGFHGLDHDGGKACAIRFCPRRNAARRPAQVPLQRRSTRTAKIFTPPVDPLASAAYSAASPQGEPPGEALWGGVAQLVRAAES